MQNYKVNIQWSFRTELKMFVSTETVTTEFDVIMRPVMNATQASPNKPVPSLAVFPEAGSLTIERRMDGADHNRTSSAFKAVTEIPYSALAERGTVTPLACAALLSIPIGPVMHIANSVQLVPHATKLFMGGKDYVKFLETKLGVIESKVKGFNARFGTPQKDSGRQTTISFSYNIEERKSK